MKIKLFIVLLATFSLYSMEEAENLLSQFQDPKIFEQPLELQKKIDACAQQLGNDTGIIQEMRALYNAREIAEVQDAYNSVGQSWFDYSKMSSIDGHPQQDSTLLQCTTGAKVPSPNLVRTLLKWGADPNKCGKCGTRNPYLPLYGFLNRKLKPNIIEIINMLIPITDLSNLKTYDRKPYLTWALIPGVSIPLEIKLSLLHHTPDHVVEKLCQKKKGIFFDIVLNKQYDRDTDGYTIQQALFIRQQVIDHKKETAAREYKRSAQEGCDSFGVN
jgi:hypothetical protein